MRLFRISIETKSSATSRQQSSAGMVTIAVVALLATCEARAGTIYVSIGYESIRRFDLATGADLGVFANIGPNDQAWGIAVDIHGNLYVATGGANTIERFTPGGVGSVFASTGLNVAYGLAFDRAGNLYAANAGNNTIERFAPGGAASVFAVRGLSYPVGLAFDRAGSLYVANNDGNTIQKFTREGVGSIFASSGLSNPTGLAFDRVGNLYVANNSGRPQTIVKFTPDGVGSIFASAGFSGALGLAFDAAGSLYVVSAADHKIVRFTRDGAGSVFARLPFGAQPNFIAIVPEPSGLPPPTVSCSTPLILECTNGAAVGTIQAEVQDTNGDPIQVVWTMDGTVAQTNNIPSGGNITASNVTFTANFELGQHDVVVSASNGQTDPVTCSTTVTVHDTTAPQIVSILATPSVLWPPNHQMVPVNLMVEAVDNCDPSPAVKIVSVTSNEPQNPFAPDWEITGAQNLNLRAERLGRGLGRVYTIVVQCQDLSGNVSTASVDVTVPHN